MSDGRDPLVPAEVDLTDFNFMPLDVRKLRDSRFTATVGGEAFKAGLLLWGASWHQSPAASLPDDDVELAQLAGFGRVVKEWKKLRAAALYGWVRCSDGRLYHPKIAEKACEAWHSKLMHAYGRMCDRIRKANKSRAEAKLKPIGIPDFETWNSGGRSDPLPPEQVATSTGIPAENALKGQGQGQGEGQGKEEEARKRASPKCPEGVDPQVWADWVALRKSKGAPVSATTLHGAEDEAAKAGMTLEAFLREWCVRGSQGLKADWLTPKTVTKPNGAVPHDRDRLIAATQLKLGQTRETHEEYPHA